MAQSGRTIDGVIALTRLVNRAVTPDRSSSIKEAKVRFDTAQKNYRSAKLPDRAAQQVESAKDDLAIAEERLAKSQTAVKLAEEKLNQAQQSQRSSEELQILADAVTTATDRAQRAQRKVDRLEESVRLIDARLKTAIKLESPTQLVASELEAERDKLSRASIQLRLRQSELKQAETELKQAQRESKSPEEIQLLIDRLNELKGNCDRAAAKVETAKSNYATAQTESETIAETYLQVEAELLTAEAELDRITQQTAAEERFEKIERAIGKAEQFSEMGSDIKAAIALLPRAEAWWNCACLFSTMFVAIVYFTPLAGVLQSFTKSIKWTLETANSIADSVDSTWAPNLQGSPKVGETIAGWEVTSAFGPRVAPKAGTSTDHGGIDLADPRGASFTTGRELYAIGKPGTKVSVTCWEDKNGGGLVATLKPESMRDRTIEYLHLSKCLTRNGETQSATAGSVIAKVGNSGTGTAPHLHLQEKNGQGEKVAPSRGMAWWALTGDEPQPVIRQNSINKQ